LHVVDNGTDGNNNENDDGIKDGMMKQADNGSDKEH